MKTKLAIATFLTTSLMYAQSAIDISSEKIDNTGKWYIGFTYASGSGTATIAYDDVQVGDDIDINPTVTTFKLGKVNSNADKLEFVYTTSKLNSDATKNIGLGINSVITIQKIRTNNLVPYFSGGVEYVKNSDAEFSGFASRLGLGIFYNINKNIELDFGYKYNLQWLTMDSDSNIDIFSFYNTMGFGLNFRF